MWLFTCVGPISKFNCPSFTQRSSCQYVTCSYRQTCHYNWTMYLAYPTPVANIFNRDNRPKKYWFLMSSHATINKTFFSTYIMFSRNWFFIHRIEQLFQVGGNKKQYMYVFLSVYKVYKRIIEKRLK